MGGVSSRPSSDPDCTLQVIGAGFSRTGTVSMALALEELLGGPVCHGGTQMHMLEESAFNRLLIENLHRCSHVSRISSSVGRGLPSSPRPAEAALGVARCDARFCRHHRHAWRALHPGAVRDLPGGQGCVCPSGPEEVAAERAAHEQQDDGVVHAGPHVADACCEVVCDMA